MADLSGNSIEYDLIVINEVIEHVFRNLPAHFQKCPVCLQTGGILYIGTLTTDNIINCPEDFSKDGFENWWYKDDLTMCRSSLELFCIYLWIWR